MSESAELAIIAWQNLSPSALQKAAEKEETMKTHKRIPALLLTASMALSMLTPAWAVEKAGTATGELQATVRIDYSQKIGRASCRERVFRAV